MEGLTKPPTSVLVQNLSPSTYRWKDEPSHSRVFWSKFKSFYLWKDESSHSRVSWSKFFYLWVERQTKPLASGLVKNLSPSTYGWKDEPSHLQVPWSKFKVLLPTGGRTNQATSKYLGTKFKSFYLQMEGRTKSLTSVLVEI